MHQPYPDLEEDRAVWHLFDKALQRQQRHCKNSRILVVDDEHLLRDSLQELLETAGYACDTAESGEAALQALGVHTYELMLLDIHMPGMDGRELLERVVNARQDISILIVSGDASWQAATATLRAGAVDFIRKPYAPGKLLDTIRNTLEKRHQEVEETQLVEQQRLSEQLHRFLVNQSPDLIFILDEQGRFQFTNEQFHSLLGYTSEELRNRPVQDLLLEPCPVLMPADTQATTYTDPIRNLELNLRKKQGQSDAGHIVVELSAERIYGPRGDAGQEELLGIYGVARDISKRKQAEALVNYQAYHDLLTGLPNRALFNDRLEQVIKQANREGRLLGIMFLDLDRFKLVNDTLGHTMGDRLLQEVARRIIKSIRKADTLSRIGGDEFLLLLPQVNNGEDVEHVASKVLAALHAPFNLDEHELFVRASIGIAIYPQHGLTPDLLIKRADMAMYEVKNSGRGAYQFYSPALDAKYLHKLNLEHGLRKALELDQFELHYQPLVQLSDRRLRALEALIRWRHPQHGLLGPDAFVAEAEENGLIIEIGRWVIEQAMADLRGWLNSGHRPVPVSINVSAVQLEYPNFVRQITDALNRYRIPGELLQLELTENVLMKSMHTVVGKLQELGELGLKIAIDDFGTGYSSLNYLKTLPIHSLKVDQTFLEDIDGRPDTQEHIVDAIALIARGLGLDLVAEGVELESQANYLMDLGCDCAQGYLYSKPLSHLETTNILDLQLLSA